MANKIQLKRGTSAPGTILDVGEPGYDSQHKILYVGNGVGQAATSFNPNSLTGASVSGNKLTFTKENSSNVVVTLPVDEAISSTSTNPVQNKVVQSAISNAITNAAEVSVGSSRPSGQQLVWFDNSGSDTKIKVRANSSSNFEEVAGLSGVYVDSGTMPAGYNIQIDPTGEPINDFFAPAGYGYGEGLVNIGNANDDATFTAALSEQFAKTSNKTRQIMFSYGGSAFVGTLWNAGNNYGLLIANSYAEPNVAYRMKQLVRVCKNGTWDAWVDNSPANNVKMKLLWNNANPSASFAAQTLALDLSGYDSILCVGKVSTGTLRDVPPVMAKIGGTEAIITAPISGKNYRRILTATTTGVTFNAAESFSSYASATMASDNTCLVPNRIYGIKGVS